MWEKIVNKKINKLHLRKVIRTALKEAGIDAGHDDAIRLNRQIHPDKNAVADGQDERDKQLAKDRLQHIEDTEEEREERNSKDLFGDEELTKHPISSVHEVRKEKKRAIEAARRTRRKMR